MLSFSITGSYTDLYELTMAEAYFVTGRQNETANFDYFFRRVPNHGGYVVFAGLNDLLGTLEDFHFSGDDLKFLAQLKFKQPFIEFLKSFHFRADVFSCDEGEVVFPNCPILRVEGNIIEAQIVETLLLNILNFESLIATKASRMRQVAGERVLSDFGLRRAQGPAGILATKASIIGGFQSTSNVYAAQLYGLDVVGTMAHSFVEECDREIDAFRNFSEARPDDCVFLVDTYDTLKSGVPNAITVAREMEQRGHKAMGVRLDSGDLAYLAKRVRAMLDAAGLHYMKILASNQLDEFVIKSLLEQGAPIDVFGVGTSLVTGRPDAALDGVYKLSFSSGRPRLKLSESLEKVTLPGIKQVVRVIDQNQMFLGADAIVLTDEGQPVTAMYHPFEPGKSLVIENFEQQPLLQKVMGRGRRLSPAPSLPEIAAQVKKRLELLPVEYKRFENPHIYKVGASEKLMTLRNRLAGELKSKQRESTVADRHSK